MLNQDLHVDDRKDQIKQIGPVYQKGLVELDGYQIAGRWKISESTRSLEYDMKARSGPLSEN